MILKGRGLLPHKFKWSKLTLKKIPTMSNFWVSFHLHMFWVSQVFLGGSVFAIVFVSSASKAM